MLFPKQEPLRQIAILNVDNFGSAAVNTTVSYEIAGQHLTQDATFEPGETHQQILIPDISSPAKLAVTIKNRQGTALATSNQPWTPQRKWQVFIVKSSHEDLGYEGTIYQKQHDNANWIDIGKKLSDPKIPMGGNKFHYNIETMVGARDYASERGETAWRNLVNTEIKTGNMSLMGAPSGVHSHWMDYEELARMTYPAKREMKDRYGLDLDTLMIVDNPSLSWSGAQAIADAGFKFVARWGQGWRTGGNNDYAHTQLPAIFWWIAPDGQHRVLYTWRSHYDMPLWYGQGGATEQQMMDLAAFEVSKSLKRIEAGTELGPYPYDAVVYPQYYDHDIPYVDHGLLAAWNEHFAYPMIKMTSPTSFFEYMEAKYGGQIPTRTGDLNNFSADYATIDPESQGWKRAAARELPFAEGMHAVAAYLDPGTQPVTAQVSHDYTLLFDYDEHSWPTLPNAEDIHVFNGNYVKKQTARRVVADSEALLQSSLKVVTDHIANPSEQRSVAVWNSLVHERDDLVTLSGKWGAMVDATTGERVPTQITAEGETVFLACRVPAYGYKVYRETGKEADPTSGPEAGTEMENEFYRIRADRTSGNVISIFDKKLQRELVDTTSKYQLNQFVAIHKNGRESVEGTEHLAANAKSVTVISGPVFKQIVTTIDDAATGAEIIQTVRLYAGIPRIDVRETVKHARMMTNTEPAERYKDNIFYAFPLAVPDGQPRAEYPGGMVRPYDDQLRWGSHDFLSANRWIDVSSKTFGVTIAPWNEQIFEFGEIRYNKFSVDYKPANSHVFGYAWSNRMTGLLDLDNNNPQFTVGYSISSHAGEWDSGAASSFGWSIASPLEAHIVSAGTRGLLDAKSQSLLSVDLPNVELSVIKESEQPGRGWIVRLVETAGKASETQLTSKLLPVHTAYLCSTAEEDQSPLPVTDNKVRVRLLPFGTATVRLIGGAVPAVVSGVTANAVSGEKVTLRWNGAPGTFYNIYRSDDPDDPATAYTLVSRAESKSFTDDHLMPSGTYYYHVAAVSPLNVQGAVSERIAVTTLDTNQEPPPPVTGLTSIALAGGRRIVAWDKSPAGDIREYVLYRSEGATLNPGHLKQIAVLPPTGFSIETYIDRDFDPDKHYQYFVVPVDWAGNRQNLQ
ncbi:MAG TPA: glycoside hydrolase family 38 C-terminal domain-containing protein [Pseudacidobacterium sp.]|nr:glycoside hydrolase family 38 C-terminal domain-containing protein [Pseudacidobacterium sp.]